MKALAGKTAVVLGASGTSNFGSAIARRLAAEGANVVIAGRRREPLDQLAQELGGTAVVCDVTDEAAIEGLFVNAGESHGHVDIAVYSAGVYAAGPIAELHADMIRPTLEVSFIGALLFFKHAAAAMSNGGSVITVSSLTARLPRPRAGACTPVRAPVLTMR